MKPSTTIFIRNLIASGKVGIHTAEKQNAQRLRINCSVQLCDSKPPAKDDIHHTVCYDQLRTEILHRIQNGHTHLLEILAEDLAALCLNDKRIASVKISVEKLDVFPDCESAGVEIVRSHHT